MDIVIQGAGPAGCVAALLASRLGLRVTLIDNQQANTFRGNAHYLNAYSLEILHQCGLPMSAILQHATPRSYAHAMAYGSSLSRIYYRLNLIDEPDFSCRYDTIGRYGAAVSVPFSCVYAELLKMMESRNIAIQWESTIKSVDMQHNIITCQNGEGDEFEIETAYLIAADGVNSGVRQLLFTPPSVTNHTQFVNITLHSSLSSFISEPSLLTWVLNPSFPACFVMHQLDGVQNCQVPVFSNHSDCDLFNFSWATNYCRELFDNDAVEFSIESVQPWMLKTYHVEQVQKDWVFLVGDSAHAMTAAGGLGLNTALADAANLIWKLHSRLKHGCLSIISSYDKERRPITKKAVTQSIDNYHDFQSVAYRAGLPVGLAPYVMPASNKLPSSIKKIVQHGASRIYQALYGASMSIPLSGEVLRHQLKVGAEKNKLHFDGIASHLYYRYKSEWVVAGSEALLEHDKSSFFNVGQLAFFNCFRHLKTKMNLMNQFQYGHWMLIICDSTQYADNLFPQLDLVDRYCIEHDFVIHNSSTLTIPELVVIRPDRVIAHMGDLQDVRLSALIKSLFN